MCVAIIWLHIWLRSWCMDDLKEARRVDEDCLHPLELYIQAVKSCCGGPGYWIKVVSGIINAFNWRAIALLFSFLFYCLLILLLSILKNNAPNTRKFNIVKEILLQLESHIETYTLMVQNFNSLILTARRSSKQK